MSAYPYIVVEDVALQREHLIEMLNSRIDIKLLRAFSNAEDAYSYMLEAKEVLPALIFLDIEMPEASGFNFLEAIKHLPVKPRIIITTAFAEYAVKGYEYNLSGYLLKPIEEAQLNRAIDKAIWEWQSLGERSALAEAAAAELLVKEKGRWVKLSYEEILYLEGANVDVRIVTLDREYRIRERIKNMDKQLPGEGFLRIHDSYIINLSHIKTYASNFTFVELCPAPGKPLKKLPVGPKYRDAFKERV